MAEGVNTNNVSGSPGGPGQHVTDPRLPLSAMQIFKLKKNWKGVKRRLEDTGVEMLIRLFRLEPSTQIQFKNIRHLETEDKLRMSEELEKHAGKMMASLDDIVNNIDDVDYAMDKITKVAQQHEQFQGFAPEQFSLMEQPFLDSVRIILEDRYTDNMDTIYRILIKFILSNLVKACR
ncbi:cytoglobin-1-like [Biomphalaria glabrata]|uniref:Globin n=2 Tax=Biomphalaria TaxID=6525 RepID=A0A9W2ZTG4_BIOGL|nr:cytoglobin-1-like [Biomphalaria glabrata]XP_055878173.1 cytoglobin-1-like [Biomphalaria glabrata]